MTTRNAGSPVRPGFEAAVLRENTMLKLLIATDGSAHAERAIDQIVIGTHGRNALAGLVPGSWRNACCT